MKKTLIFLVLLTFSATAALATDLDTKLASTSLSNGVSGEYFCNNTTPTDGTAFTIFTAHQQGSKVYSTANFISDILYHDFAAEKFASTDLPSSWTTFDSTAYDMSTWSAK